MSIDGTPEGVHTNRNAIVEEGSNAIRKLNAAAWVTKHKPETKTCKHLRALDMGWENWEGMVWCP